MYLKCVIIKLNMNFITKIAQTYSILTYSQVSILEIVRNGFSINSSQIVQNIAQHCGKNLRTIIDVGANKGQFAIAAHREFKDADIYSYEPVPNTFKKLEYNTKNIDKINVFNFGLGDSNSEIDFYENEYSHASSALPVSDIQVKVAPQTKKTRTIKVPIKRLDDVFEKINTNDGLILLKIDVQGFEKEVLLGGGQFLNRVDYLLFETSFERLYDGEPLFDEMNDFVKKQGFKLIRPVGFWQTKDLQILQMDMLYGKE